MQKSSPSKKANFDEDEEFDSDRTSDSSENEFTWHMNEDLGLRSV